MVYLKSLLSRFSVLINYTIQSSNHFSSFSRFLRFLWCRFSGLGSRVGDQALEVALFKKIWFFIFQIKMQNEKRISNLNFNINFENGKIISFYVLCLNFSIEAKIRSLCLISISIYQKTKSYFRYMDCLYCYSLTLTGWGDVLI